MTIFGRGRWVPVRNHVQDAGGLPEELRIRNRGLDLKLGPVACRTQCAENYTNVQLRPWAVGSEPLLERWQADGRSLEVWV